jgi:small subunit ribosomal protein S8
MVTTDPIADMLARINNGYLARKTSIELPWSKTKESLAKIFSAEGYLENCQVRKSDNHKILELTLKYNQKTPAVSLIRRISRPSLRVYAKKNNLPQARGLGITVISTSKGLMTDKDARKKGLGGEIICEIS